jgi:acetyl coenzyme A synthetase (ADP forming)-like protein
VGSSTPRAAYPAQWEADALLSDGVPVHIRPIRPDDGAALVALHGRLSPETIYRRFFSSKPRLTDADVERFTHVDYRDRQAFVAVRDDRLIAVGRYDRLPGTADAEVAFVVEDMHQGRGLGTLLLEYLAGAAREQGITRFVAETLTENRPMRDVFRSAGFHEVVHVDGSVTSVILDIQPTDAARFAVDERGWQADVLSIHRLLRPRSIVVIGAGRSPQNIGHIIVDNLQRHGFTGALSAINPHGMQIGGVPTHTSITDVPGEIDLAIIAVPAAAVIDTADACAARGVKGLVVVSSGFAEMGVDGAQQQRELVEHVRRGGMRLIGPNCMGIINTDPDIRMDATFAAGVPVPGRVGFASQSGALGIAMLERARALGLGLSSFVSMGNKADVSGNDLLRYWEGDPRTDVILLYLESFGNPRLFSRIARRVSRTKPIVAVKSGRSASGARAAGSHTAAMATPDTAVDALFLQAGVIRVDSLEQLFDVAGLLAHQPLPAGDRVAVMGNGGGAGILAVDALEAAGLDVVALDETTQAAIRAAFPTTASANNPVDLGAGASPEAFQRVIEILLRCDDVDSVIVMFATVPTTPTDDIARAIRAASDAVPGKPVMATFLGLDRAPAPLSDEAERIPFFAFPEHAAPTLASVTMYARWRERPEGSHMMLAGIDSAAAQAVVHDALQRNAGGGWLSPGDAATLLTSYGIPLAAALHADSADAAAKAAKRLGFPVALKAAAATLVHKTDVGGVVINLATQAAVSRAYTGMHQRLGDAMGGASVQRMAAPGVETIVGVVHDPLFGPLLMFGSGGTAAEVFNDRAFRILPLTDLDAHELFLSIRGAPLLFGHRGAPAVDVNALEDLLLRVARLAEDVPQLAEMDLNPAIVSEHGAVVVDAKVRVVPWTSHPELDVRQLRRPS